MLRMNSYAAYSLEPFNFLNIGNIEYLSSLPNVFENLRNSKYEEEFRLISLTKKLKKKRGK